MDIQTVRGRSPLDSERQSQENVNREESVLLGELSKVCVTWIVMDSLTVCLDTVSID